MSTPASPVPAIDLTPWSTGGARGQFRIGPHTDFDTVTVLDRGPGLGGLQVFIPTESFEVGSSEAGSVSAGSSPSGSAGIVWGGYLHEKLAAISVG